MSLYTDGESFAGAGGLNKLNNKTVFVGSSAPTSTFVGQVWIDSANNIAKFRNGADSAFVDLVDLLSAQTISGVKTFSNKPDFTAAGSPFTVTNTGVVANLNASLLEGSNKAFYRNASNLDAGTVPIARSAPHTKEIFLTQADFKGFGGITEAEVNSNDNAQFVEWNFDAVGERIRTQIRIPTGVTSVTLAEIIYRDSGTLTIDVDTRGIDPDGTENVSTGGTTDGGSFVNPTSASGVHRILDVTSAFNAANLIQAGETLAIHIRCTAFTSGQFNMAILRITFG